MTRPLTHRETSRRREREAALAQLAYEVEEAGVAVPIDHGDDGRLVVDRLDQIESRPVEWLWPKRLPLGKLWLLDGLPGTGKSHLTLEIAAAVTTGRALPGGKRTEPADVIVVALEDDPADTIRPRAEAAGADIARLHIVRGVRKREDILPPQLPGDVRSLQELVLQYGARVVIIDPLTAYLGAGIDSHKDQDIRRALLPVVRLAEETGALVLAVRHLSKQHGGRAVYAGLGSVGIVGAARGALLLAPDPDDDTRRILAVSKSNLGPPASSLVFSIVENTKGSRIEWHGESTLTADELVREPSGGTEPAALDEAVDWLRQALADGPKYKRDLLRAARAEAIAERTLERAKLTLGVEHRREGFGASFLWSLPIPTSPAVASSPRPDVKPTEGEFDTTAARTKLANSANVFSLGELGEIDPDGEFTQGNEDEAAAHYDGSSRDTQSFGSED